MRPLERLLVPAEETVQRAETCGSVEHLGWLELRRVEMRRGVVTALVQWMMTVFWMGVIFARSATPSFASPLEPAYDFILRKLAHVTVYAILAVLLFRAFRLHVASPTHA